MKSFQDKKGVEYEIEITAGRPIKRLIGSTGINFLEPAKESEKLFALLQSPFQCMSAVWTLIRKQALEHLPTDPNEEKDDEDGELDVITHEDLFWERLTSEQTADAINGFKEELRDFIQSLGATTLLRQMDRASDFEEKQRDMINDSLEKLDATPAIQEGFTTLINDAKKTIKQKMERISQQSKS